MLFNSIDFLIFFPIATSIYFFMPKRFRHIWLLFVSYYFYMHWKPGYALLILLSSIITYVSGLLIETSDRIDNPAKRKTIKNLSVAGSICSNLFLLFVFKYADFVWNSLDFILKQWNIGSLEGRLNLLLPVGISFYTFQALGYTIDVYRGEIHAEKNFLRYALFVSFFPQLVAGPIERSKNLLPQIQNIQNVYVWDFDRIRDGLLLMVWGLFQKLVIADRASLLVHQVYDNYVNYGFVEIAAATIAFAFQIYCDFNGYTSIACGAAQVMGIRLMRNFKQPYLAGSVKEFWKRWHISLTAWFTDYLYIPLGGNRKGLYRKYLNISLVFLVSGLWHGADWSFVVWGGVHALYQILEDVYERFKNKKNESSHNRKYLFCRRIVKIFFTFVKVDFAWIFFASKDFATSLHIITQMVSHVHTSELSAVLNMGFSQTDGFLLLISGLILIIVDILHEKGISIFALVNRQNIWLRWTLYLGLIWITIMFGVYGANYDTSQFIYFQF